MLRRVEDRIDLLKSSMSMDSDDSLPSAVRRSARGGGLRISDRVLVEVLERCP